MRLLFLGLGCGLFYLGRFGGFFSLVAGLPEISHDQARRQNDTNLSVTWALAATHI